MTVRNVEATYQYSPITDEARLVRQAKSGDSEAFAQLYDAYVERVYRYILLRVSDDLLTEDLVSQVFLKAWQNLERYRQGGAPFVAWLFTIARNLVIDQYRAKKNVLPLDDAKDLPAEMDSPHEQAESNFDIEALRDALQYLSPDQQQALLLKYMAELSNENIAKIMNKHEGTVRGLQMRGLRALAKILTEKEIL